MRLLDEEYLTVAQAAAALHVNRSTIRRWIDQGILPAYRIGQRRVAIKRQDIARLITPAREAPEQGGGTAEPATEIVQRLSPAQQRQGLRAVAELRRLHEAVRAQIGDQPVTPSWQILADQRDERSRQLP